MPASQPKKKPRTNKTRKISKNCPHCGAPIGSGEEAKQCSYCGSSLASTRQSRAKEKKENQKLLQRITEIAEADGHPTKLSIGLNNGWAIASLLLGILAVAGFFYAADLRTPECSRVDRRVPRQKISDEGCGDLWNRP